jgi:hypothetical protein
MQCSEARLRRRTNLDQAAGWQECGEAAGLDVSGVSPVTDDYAYSALVPSCGIVAVIVGQADTLQQVLEAKVVTQLVHAGIYMKIDEPVGMFLVGFL